MQARLAAIHAAVQPEPEAVTKSIESMVRRFRDDYEPPGLVAILKQYLRIRGRGCLVLKPSFAILDTHIKIRVVVERWFDFEM